MTVDRPRPGSRRASLAAGALLAVFVVLAGAGAQRMSLTYDEGNHFQYGWKLLTFDASRGSDDSKMPFSALNALPWRVATLLDPDSPRDRSKGLELGRYVTVASGALMGWLIFRWAQQLYGFPAGLLALTLFAFDPNFLAHAGLVTTDLYAAWTVALTVWSFWRLLNHEGPGTWRAASLSAAMFGLAQLAKYTSIYLVLVLVITTLGHAFPELRSLVRAGNYRGLGERGLRAAKYSVLYVVAFLVAVNLGYWGQDSLRPLSSYEFRSRRFQGIQATLSPLLDVPVPVAAPYLEGLDRVLANERRGTNPYLLGSFGQDGIPGRRFPSYFAVAWLYKEPIATQVILLLALVAYALRFRRFDFRRDEWPIACPVLLFAVYFTFVYNYQIGYRYVLMVPPLLFVFAGSLLRDAGELSRGVRIALGGLLLWLVVSTLSYSPHFLAYFNEFVWDRKQAYRVLIDSNLDWGQGERYVRRYLREHPDVLRDPTGGPRSGTLLVSANNLAGLRGAEWFRWLRENFEPVGHVAYIHLLFRITPEALRQVTDPIPPDHGERGQ